MIHVKDIEVKIIVTASNSSDDKDCEMAEKSMKEEEEKTLSLREGASDILEQSCVTLSSAYPNAYKIEIKKEMV